MKKLLIVDGNSIMNRAFYGVRALSTSSGLMTNAIYGTATIIKKNLELVCPDYFAVAFDVSAPTFRHEMYEGYKANRHGMPDELRTQVPYIKKMLSLMGARCIELEGFEADDIIGTVSKKACENGIFSYIATGDRDSLQLISSCSTVLLATNNDTVEFDTGKFIEVYGITPDRFVDVKALMGDSSDCIPGVAGIGEKTALKLIAEYGSLDGLFDDLESKKLSPSVLKKLEAGKDSAYMSQTLARISCNAPISESLEDMAYKGFDSDGLFKLFEELEFNALIKKFELEKSGSEAKSEKTCDVCALTQLACDNVSVYPDVENEKIYLCDGTRCSCCDVQPALDFVNGCKRVIVHDKKRFLHQLKGIGAKLTAHCDDVMLMAYVLSAGDSDYSLEKLSRNMLLPEINDSFSASENVMSLYQKYTEKLSDDEKKLYETIELPLCTVLYEMEDEGFLVDTKELEIFGDKLGEMQREYEQRIYLLAGEVFNINSPKQLGVVLFEKLGLPARKKTKSGYSTSAEVLEQLRPYSNIIDDILDYRQVGKLRGTYAEGLLKAADENGRVHTSFKQALTSTGRLSSTEPNLQNIPIKTDLGREFRRFFIPGKENRILIDADYSQIELRLLAAISGDENMIDAFNSGYDIHTATAMRVFGVSAEDVTIPLRKRAKAINFGIVYGIGDYTLAMDLHVTKREAAEYIEGYFKTYPGVKSYLDNVIERAREDKYVKTLFGRKRFIPELSSSKKPERAFGERIAMNSPIQGTAADVIKLAMVNVSNKLKEAGYDARLILQVHDELIIDSSVECADEVEALLKSEMENAVSLSVPLTVEISRGKTWYDAK